MQTCLYTHVPSFEAHYQRNDETIIESSDSDALLEIITEQANWIPMISTEASDTFCLDSIVQQEDLGDALELNRQLNSTLQRKQNEISALKEKNTQLRDLVRQAEHLAHLLDTIAPSTRAAKPTTACSPLSYGLGCSPPERHSTISDQHDEWDRTTAYESQCTEVFTSTPLHQTDQTHRFPSNSAHCPETELASPRTTGVKRCLWSTQESSVSCESLSGHNSSAEDTGTFQRDAKRRRDDQELLQAQLQQYLEDIVRDLQQEASAVSQDGKAKGQISNPINIVGNFNGLKIVRTTLSTDTVSSEGGEAMCFKTSIREHSTIRTRVFPHGKSFTSPTPTGGYRFLWIPNEQ